MKDVRAVVAAGQALEVALDADPPVRRVAARRLESALVRQETGKEALSALMFATAEREPVPETTSLALEETLGSVLLEVQVANVSLLGGAVVGEAGISGSRQAYQEALQELRSTAKQLDEAISAADGAVPIDGQLGFRVRTRRDSGEIASSTLAGARTKLSTAVDTTFNGIVDESRTIATAVWEEASKLPGSKVLDDVIGLARDLRLPVDSLGKLIACGLRRLHAAINALKRLFGLAGAEEAKAHVEGIWSELRAGDDVLRRALSRLYGAERAMAAKERAIGADVPRGRLDEASSALNVLAERFRESMRLARKLLRALVVASEFVGALVVFVPGVNLHHLALTAAGFLFLLTGVVLSGMDYTDSGLDLGRVRGVRAVIGELAT